MLPPKLIRQKVLEALNMASGYGKHEDMIRQMVKTLAQEDPGLQEIRDASERLLADSLIRSEKDEDNVVLWYITPKGAAKLKII